MSLIKMCTRSRLQASISKIGHVRRNPFFFFKFIKKEVLCSYLIFFIYLFFFPNSDKNNVARDEFIQITGVVELYIHFVQGVLVVVVVEVVVGSQ